MAVNWTPNLAIGVDTIDGQHQELFRRINQLYEAITTGESEQIVAETLKYLYDYTDFHFREEQEHMEEHDYPQLNSHKGLHSLFIRDLKSLSNELEQDGPSIELAIAVQRRVREWLVDHIQREDKQYGLYLKSLS